MNVEHGLRVGPAFVRRGLGRLGLGRMAWAGVMVAFAIRMVYLVVVKRHQTLLINDSFYYSAQATQLARGKWFVDLAGDPAAEHGPLTAVLLTPFSWMDDPVNWQRFGVVLIGTAVVAMLAALATRIHSPRAGAVTAWVAALSPNLFINDTLIMSEPAALLMMTITLLGLHRLTRTRSTRDAIVVGLFVGLAALARSELLLLAPLAAIALTAAWGRSRAVLTTTVVVMLTAALTISPWSLFNTTRFDRAVVLTTNDGTTLLAANCPGSYFGEMLGSADLSCVLGAPEAGDPSVRSAAQRARAVNYVLEHPGRVPVVLAARLGRLLDVYAVGHMVNIEVDEERSRTVAWLGVAAWWIMVPLTVLGLRRLSRSHRWLLALPVVSTVAVSLAVYGGHRPRAPLEGVLAITAAVGVLAVRDHVFGRSTSRGSRSLMPPTSTASA